MTTQPNTSPATSPATANLTFAEMTWHEPQYDEIATQFAAIDSDFDNATDPAGRAAALLRWESYRRELDTWSAMVELRFNQDTRDADYKRAREYADELRPRITDLETNLKRKLLTSAHRPELEQRFGAHAFRLWEADIATFEPAIQDDLVKESRLQAEYVELLASARFQFKGETLNLSGLRRFTTSPDRDTRHAAETLRWGWFNENGETLDRLYDELTTLRDGMARKLRYDNYIGLGYKQMHRIDYNEADVERFRAQIRAEVVPLATELHLRQARDLNLDPLMYWDEGIHDLRGNPAPKGDHDWMLTQAQTMFDKMGPDLSSFFKMMRERDLLDLKTREGKAGGGFCTSLNRYGVPFIFANFNGTKGDVEVFTHEAGHAFQAWRSRGKELTDYLWPTLESCEIHSMSLEFLTWPFIDLFFGDDAERFRKTHLTESLLFLTYGVAVDHFQPFVYASPTATPKERKQMWRECERMYLPWRLYGDLSYPAEGGLWQGQTHIYSRPFYYIDYVLAQTCALQFWARSRNNFDDALAAYIALCDRGGEAPFQQLARGAGLVSPFDDGCLTRVVNEAKAALT